MPIPLLTTSLLFAKRFSFHPQRCSFRLISLRLLLRPRESSSAPPSHTPLWPAISLVTPNHSSNRFHNPNSSLKLSLSWIHRRQLQESRKFLTSRKVDFWSQHLVGMDLQDFDKVFPEIVSSIVDDYLDSEVKQAALWLRQVVEYNVPFGKKTRGVAVVKAVKLISKASHLKDEDLHLAQVLGWCVEMLQAVFLVADDIMDQSHTRRGKPCWYKRKGVGLIAINDAFSLESSIYMLLKRYFRHKDYYVNLTEIFHEITFQTVMGQSLDLMISRTDDDQLDLSKFTRETYDAIVKYKTAFYSFYLPVAVALHMAGIADDKVHLKARNVLLEMGHLFQVQDDYLDCFGDPEVTGKIGTDIEEGKCCWLVVTALERTSESQKTILRDNYGRNDPVCTAKIKQLYVDLDLTSVFRNYEEDCYGKIVKLIDQMEGHLPTEIFHELVSAIYKRQR